MSNISYLVLAHTSEMLGGSWGDDRGLSVLCRRGTQGPVWLLTLEQH